MIALIRCKERARKRVFMKVDISEAGSNNCHSTASAMKPWKWPTTKNRDAAIQDLKSVLEAYPKDVMGSLSVKKSKRVENEKICKMLRF